MHMPDPNAVFPNEYGAPRKGPLHIFELAVQTIPAHIQLTHLQNIIL